MSTSFRWPSQLQAVEVKDSTLLDAPRRFVLVRKKTDPKTGKQKTSSSSNGVIDVAFAVKLGLVPATGLPGLLSYLNHNKILRLLKHNTVTLVKPKHATTNGIHATKAILKLAEEALSAVLGPAYWEANQALGPKAALKTTKIIPWIKTNLENKNSALCNSLLDTPFEDLIGHAVKKSRFTDEQIAFALKQAETGTRIDEICRKMGISDATFYKWRQKYGGLGPSELRKLKQLEEENSKLKRIVADLSLDKAVRRQRV